MGRRQKTVFGESAIKNNVAYIHYIDRLTELALCMFDWQGMPDEVNLRFLEKTLLLDGRCVFFKDEELGYMVLQVTNTGMLDVYHDPTTFQAFGINGYVRDLSQEDGVIIYNNFLRKPSIMDIKMYAQRLYNYDRIIDVNANAQKTPILIECDEAQKLTLLNLYKEYDGNAPVIFGAKNVDLKNNVAVLTTGAPFIADSIEQLKLHTWDEAMSCLGIENVGDKKKERMIVSETMQGMGATIASRYSRLEMRRTACEQINKMFGLNVSVDFREDYRAIVNDQISPSEDEGLQAGGEDIT